MFSNSRFIILIVCSLIKVTVSASTSEEAIRYKKEKLKDLIQLLSLPINSNTVIVGNYESFSPDLRENIHNFYTSCANLDVPEVAVLNKYDRPLVSVIIDWTQVFPKDELPIQQAVINGITACEGHFQERTDAPKGKMGKMFIPFGNISEQCLLPISTTQNPAVPTATGQTPAYPSQSGQTFMGSGPTGPIPVRPGPTGPIPTASMQRGPSATDSTVTHAGATSAGSIPIRPTPMHSTPSQPPPTYSTSMGHPPTTSAPEAQPAGKKYEYIWDVDSRLRKMIPTRICARLFIVETILQRLNSNAMNRSFLEEFHKYLISVVEGYESSKKLDEDDITLHAAIFNAFTELTKWSALKFRETEKLKRLTAEVPPPEIASLDVSYLIFLTRLPDSGTKSFEKTWSLLKKILVYPEDTDPVILGNLEFLPESAVNLIHDLLHTAFERAFPSDEIRALQESLTLAVVRYKTDHIKIYLIQALYNLAFLRRLDYHNDSDSSSAPIYDKIENKAACIYEPDYPIHTELLGDYTDLTQVAKAIMVLPPESCVRIAIFKACSNKIYNEPAKITYEKQVIDAIKVYAMNRNEDYLRTAIIQIHHSMITQFEIDYKKKHNMPYEEPMNVDQPSVTEPPQETTQPLAIVPVVSMPSPAQFRARASFKGKQVPRRRTGVAMFRRGTTTPVGVVYQDAVNSPRTGGIRIEEPMEDVPIVTPQSSEEQPPVEPPPTVQRQNVEGISLVLPGFVYSDILVVTLNLDINTRKEIREMYECFEVDNVAKDADYLLSDAQNRLIEVIWTLKNNMQVTADIRTSIDEETKGCRLFVDRNQIFRNRVGADFLANTLGTGTKRGTDTRPEGSGEADVGAGGSKQPRL